jgi:UDP-N-acetylglucosamine diphosphorylase / glucose-1-phosphate thymidylyltransferase / UDP-N-acetylgalactosamine diphosphorylase / glucosamine-1-phosphate N-acetyltransferase / galactosamine-1-phosphate N-acetyltransferase
MMNYFSDTYFPQLGKFTHNDIFQNIKQVWDPLKNLNKIITKILSEDSKGSPIESVSGLTIDRSSSVKGIVVNGWIKLETSIISHDLEIKIDSGTILEPTAIIKGPSVIGKNNDIRQGSYIRGNVIVGNNCVIGHCTEIKNSLLMNHVEAGHFNYIGDSILGSYVNMGAGSRLANVQFRGLQEKMTDSIKDIEISIENKIIATGLSKLGSVIGDNVEIGCNAVLSPGTLIGKDNWIYPNCTVSKGFHPPGHFITSSEHKPKSRPT